MLHFHITSRCQLRCKHCCVNAGLKRRGLEFSLGEIRKMLDQAVKYGMEFFDVSGGEPLILEQQLLLNVLRYASQRGLLTSLNTNAYDLSKKYASELAGVGLNRVKLSLYGACPQVHDEFTGVSGSFDRVISGIKASKYEDLEVWVHYVVTPKNLQETLTLPSLLEPIGVDVVQLGSIIPSGRGVTAENYVFTEGRLTEVIEVLKNSFSDLLSLGHYSFTTALYPRLESLPFEGRYCNYFVGTLVVDTGGNVIPCCILPKSLRSKLGNIKEESLHEIYSLQRIRRDPVSYWLWKGHKAMMKKLGIKKTSHNLCSLCIDMLYKLRKLAS